MLLSKMVWFAFFITIGIATPSLAQAPANTCDSQRSINQSGFTGDFIDAVQYIARLFAVSIIAELPVVKHPVVIRPGALTLKDAVVSVIGFEGVACSESAGVVHISQANVEKSQANGLNFKFRGFTIPSTVDSFCSLLRSRLHEEPWTKNRNDRQLMATPNGYISYDAKSRPLKEETISNMSGRELLLHAASQQRIVSVLELSLNKLQNAKDAWSAPESKFVCNALK